MVARMHLFSLWELMESKEGSEKEEMEEEMEEGAIQLGIGLLLHMFLFQKYSTCAFLEKPPLKKNASQTRLLGQPWLRWVFVNITINLSISDI
jgi:hypothetical protein